MKKKTTTTARGFSLIEAMMSAALVGVLGAGALSLVSHVFSRGADERQRALGIADATASLDRVAQLVGVSASFGGAARLCELLEATGGPLAGGTTPTGICPERAATNIPIAGTRLKRAVNITAIDFDGVPGFQVIVTVSGAGLARPIVLTTALAIGGA